MKKAWMIMTVATMLFGVACAGALSSQKTGTAPSRSVKGQVLTSPSLPAVRLTFDKAFKYAGTQDFILYNVARAEQHFFVDADKQGRIKRFYWVQFEGYLPDNTHTYRYVANKTVKLNGLDFIADAYIRTAQAEAGRTGSDGTRAVEFLKSKGYQLSGNDVMLQRLVHLVDESKRNELMIIYLEDLGDQGLTAADLAPNGPAAARRDDVLKGLLERAQKGMIVSSEQ